MFLLSKIQAIPCFVAALLMLTLSFPAATRGQVKEAPPAERLSGSWRAELAESQALLLLIRVDEVEMKVDSGGVETSLWTAKLVIPKEHSEKHMDWVDVTQGGRALPDNKLLYRLTGNTLLVIGGGPKERPARFYSGPGGEPKTLVFTRVK